MNRQSREILYLSACVLNGVTPEREITAQIDLNALYDAAMKQHLTSILCTALASGGAFADADGDVAAKWQSEKMSVIRKIMLLDRERSGLFRFMEENGIWYMPLKGILLKDMYPEFGMREMSDNDILADPKKLNLVKNYMVSQGYTVTHYGITTHDEYEKPPCCHFEIHRTLYRTGSSLKRVRYYENVKERLIRDTADGYGYHFTDEDYYLFMIAHAFRHYEVAGTGLRNLLDIYVYLQKKEDSLDWNYIRGELEKLDMAEFEESLRTLSLTYLKDPEKTWQICEEAGDTELLEEMVEGGIYGSHMIFVHKQLNAQVGDLQGRGAKLRYYWRRMFPPMSWYEIHHPFLYKYKIFLPFYSIYRLIKGFFLVREKTRQEIELLEESLKNKE